MILTNVYLTHPPEGTRCPLPSFNSATSLFIAANLSSAAKAEGLKLERKPLELLVLLVAKHGQVVTRDEIAGHLWEREVFVDIEHGINTGVLAMEYAWRNNSVLCLHNLMPEPREIRFRLRSKSPGEGDHLMNLLSDDHSQADENGRHCIVLEPYGYRWFRVGGLDYLLRRSDV